MGVPRPNITVTFSLRLTTVIVKTGFSLQETNQHSLIDNFFFFFIELNFLSPLIVITLSSTDGILLSMFCFYTNNPIAGMGEIRWIYTLPKGILRVSEFNECNWKCNFMAIYSTCISKLTGPVIHKQLPFWLLIRLNINFGDCTRIDASM